MSSIASSNDAIVNNDSCDLNNIFQFDDNLFTNTTINNSFILNNTDVINTIDSNTNATTWLSDLLQISNLDCNIDKFAIFHLNICSMFNKMVDVDQILNLGIYDIVMINERCLDFYIPQNFYAHANY